MNQVEVKRQQIQTYAEIIGIVTLLLLGGILGNRGIAYAAAALECSALLLCIVNRSVADTAGRILRGRRAKGQYRNVSKMRKSIMLLQSILGAVLSLLLAVFSKGIAVHIFRLPCSALLIALFAPAVFLRSISCVLLGYFQGEGSELPSAAAGVVRQVFLLGFALLFGNIFKDYGKKVSSLLGRQEFTDMYAGAGLAVAVILTELLLLIFLLLIYRGSMRRRKKQDQEGMKATESFLDLTRILYGSMGLQILISLFERLPVCLGLVFFMKSAGASEGAASEYGSFYGKYMAVCFLLFLVSAASLLPVCARIVSGLKKEEYRYARNSFQAGIHLAFAGSLFSAVFTAVTAKQLAELLCPEQAGQAAEMLRFGSILIVFLVLAMYFQRILLLCGKKYGVLGSLGLMNVVFVVGTAVFLNIGGAGIMALVYGGLLGGGVLAAALGFLAFRQLKSGLNVLGVLIVPAGAAAVAGLLGVFVEIFLTPHLGNLMSVLLSFLLSFGAYLAVLLFLHNFSRQELTVLQSSPLMKLFLRLDSGKNV